MMKTWLLVAAATALTLASVSTQAAGPPVESRLTYLTHCHETGHGTEENDWVTHRCTGVGGAHAWILYHEGTRMALGFGAKANYAGMYAAVRDDKWPVEWRLRGGKPFAAIVRVKEMEDSPTSLLMVYHLTADGMSCIAGEARDNAQARAMADGPTPKDCLKATPEG
jgi:hypothetical protein